jgi:chromate transporter
VILNLAVWFGQQVLFPLGQPDFYAVFLALLFFLGLWRGKWEIIPVVFAGGLLGLVGKLLVGA